MQDKHNQGYRIELEIQTIYSFEIKIAKRFVRKIDLELELNLEPLHLAK